MKPIDETTLVIRNETLATGEVDGELVALDIAKGECFGMDNVGSEVWALAKEPVTVGAMVDTLTERYDVGQEQCLADLLPFVGDLIQDGLLNRLAD